MASNVNVDELSAAEFGPVTAGDGPEVKESLGGPDLVRSSQ